MQWGAIIISKFSAFFTCLTILLTWHRSILGLNIPGGSNKVKSGSQVRQSSVPKRNNKESKERTEFLETINSQLPFWNEVTPDWGISPILGAGICIWNFNSEPVDGSSLPNWKGKSAENYKPGEEVKMTEENEDKILPTFNDTKERKYMGEGNLMLSKTHIWVS